jgi:hypothetical protein
VEPFIIGFGGVLAGAVLTGLAQTWRHVVDSRSAAQIIRTEVQDNANRAALAIAHGRDDVRMRDDGWKGHRIQLIPLLPREVLLHMSVHYGACWIIDDWISRMATKPKEAKQQIDQWVEGALLDAAFLMQLGNRSRFAQMMDLILGRPTFPRGAKGKAGSKESFAEMREKVMRAAQPTADDAH